MKSLLILGVVLELGVMNSMGQAFVNANNSGQGVFIEIQDPAIDAGAAVKVGTAATAAGFIGAGPGNVDVSMFAAPAGTSLIALEATKPLFTGFTSTSTATGAQGTIAPGASFQLPTATGFDGSGLVEFIFFGTVTSGGKTYSGYSTEGLIQPITQTAVNGGTPEPFIWGTGSGSGITSFVLTPPQQVTSPVPDQSSTMALGGLSAVALLFFGRRK